MIVDGWSAAPAPIAFDGALGRAAPRPMSERRRAYLWERRADLIHRLKLSALYHVKRSRFFDNLDRASTALAVIAGPGAVVTLLNTVLASSQLWLAAGVSIASTTALVFAFGKNAKRHTDLANGFRKILADVERAGEYLTGEQLDEFFAVTTDLEQEEPSAMTALQAECENQLHIAATGEPVVQLPLHQRLFKHFLDFEVIAGPPSRPVAPPPGGR